MIKELIPTLDDLPANKANCATCTREGAGCARSKNIKNREKEGITMTKYYVENQLGICIEDGFASAWEAGVFCETYEKLSGDVCIIKSEEIQGGHHD